MIRLRELDRWQAPGVLDSALWVRTCVVDHSADLVGTAQVVRVGLGVVRGSCADGSAKKGEVAEVGGSTVCPVLDVVGVADSGGPVAISRHRQLSRSQLPFRSTSTMRTMYLPPGDSTSASSPT